VAWSSRRCFLTWTGSVGSEERRFTETWIVPFSTIENDYWQRVPVKNSIWPIVTEFGRHGDTVAGRVGPQPSSLTTGSRDDPRPRCLGLRPHPPRQLSRRLA